ncbi:MAG: TIGR03084 family metal-binding protein [Desulfobacterales bacterium]
MKQICADLKAEYDALDAIVSTLDTAGWATKTYCDDWTIQEEIAHLAFFDGTARLSATDPEAFEAHKKAFSSGDAEEHGRMTRFQTMDPLGLLAEWREIRAGELEAFARHDPKDRLPWYGPTMSAKSKATARLMETWAHGQDVVDVTGAARPTTDRIKHVAHIGVITFGWAFTIRDMEVPTTPVHVALNGPSGDRWTWGPEDAADSVKGNADEFCLVATQRRHHEDTNLVITGETANSWILIAQAFAGGPDKHPAPGTFPKPSA